MSDATASIRRHAIALGAVASVMVLSMGVMGAATSLSGAVVSSGTLVVETSVKKVQHPGGGVVQALLVDNGAHVEAGDLLIRMDETVARANLNATTKAMWELEARRARLEGERDGKDNFDTPVLLKDANDAAADAIVAGERRFMRLRLDASEGQKQQLREQAAQLRDEIGGLDDQLASKKKESDFLERELTGVQELWEQRLVSLTRLTALQRDQARLLGDRGRLTASIAQARGKISETELKILQVDQDARTAVAKELADIRARSAEAVEKQVAARDQADKLEIRAPQSGVVHDLAVHTKGGVIAPGETVMTIVPEADKLVVEAHVTPQDIDQVVLGESAMLRFSNFNQRTTPEVEGHVSRIGADLSRDDKSAPPFYTVRIAIDEQSRAALGGARLVPGMPVDTFIRTSKRTVLSYLLKPFADQMERAFREK